MFSLKSQNTGKKCLLGPQTALGDLTVFPGPWFRGAAQTSNDADSYKDVPFGVFDDKHCSEYHNPIPHPIKTQHGPSWVVLVTKNRKVGLLWTLGLLWTKTVENIHR